MYSEELSIVEVGRVFQSLGSNIVGKILYLINTFIHVVNK